MRIWNQNLLIIMLTIVTISPAFIQVAQSAPPPSEQTQYFYSDCSVYVSEELPDSNFNSGLESIYLKVGEGDEFYYDYLSYVKFNSIELPPDAVIEQAEIGLFLPANPGNVNVKMFYAREPWVDSSLTWNNKPIYKVWSSKINNFLGKIDEINVSSTGWHYWDATNLVKDWLDGSKVNYGIVFESFKEEDFLFSSDDSTYFKPRLRITYLSSGGSSDAPEDPPEDSIPCTINYSVSPLEPHSGDNVTINVTASDNIAMEYVSIQKGGVEVALCSAQGTQTSLSFSYSEVLYAGSYTFSIFADDVGSPSPQGETFYVDVIGSGTPPVVSLDIEFRDMNAIPASHRLLPGDNQMINVTVTASDPDGINQLTFDSSTSIPEDVFFDPPQIEISHTFSVLNDEISDRLFTCHARVYDLEGESTRVDGEDITIDVPYQWYWGLPFFNWGCDENHTWGWEMMEFIFGEDDVWLQKDWGWKRPRAERMFEYKVRTGGRGGQCYGMCALSLELAHPGSDLYANYLQDSAITIDELESNNWNYTWRYYYARQEGQYSRQIQDMRTDQFWAQNGLSTLTSSGLHPHLDDVLENIIDDIESGDPGILGIRGDGGHAVVPWRVVPGIDDSPTKVYVYDPNRNYASTHDSTDYSNTRHYPFIEVGVESTYDGWWSYVWNSTSTWDDNIYYYSYDHVMGNAGDLNYLDSVGISDQCLPSSTQVSTMGWGDASFYAVDGSGRKTGYVNGSVVVEIPGSYPVLEYASSASSSDMFVFPSNVELSFHMISSVDNGSGTYGLALWDEDSFYSLENASCEKDSEDVLVFSPIGSSSQQSGYSMRFVRGELIGIRGNDPLEYSLMFGKSFELRGNEAYREYKFSSSGESNSDVEVMVSEDMEDIVVESFDSGLEFSLATRSTESLLVDPSLEFIPESVGEFSLESYEKTLFSPKSWETSEVSGSFSSSSDTQSSAQDDQVPGFESILVLCAVGIYLMFFERKK